MAQNYFLGSTWRFFLQCVTHPKNYMSGVPPLERSVWISWLKSIEDDPLKFVPDSRDGLVLSYQEYRSSSNLPHYEDCELKRLMGKLFKVIPEKKSESGLSTYCESKIGQIWKAAARSPKHVKLQEESTTDILRDIEMLSQEASDKMSELHKNSINVERKWMLSNRRLLSNIISLLDANPFETYLEEELDALYPEPCTQWVQPSVPRGEPDDVETEKLVTLMHSLEWDYAQDDTEVATRDPSLQV